MNLKSQRWLFSRRRILIKSTSNRSSCARFATSTTTPNHISHWFYTVVTLSAKSAQKVFIKINHLARLTKRLYPIRQSNKLAGIMICKNASNFSRSARGAKNLTAISWVCALLTRKRQSSYVKSAPRKTTLQTCYLFFAPNV